MFTRNPFVRPDRATSPRTPLASRTAFRFALVLIVLVAVATPGAAALRTHGAVAAPESVAVVSSLPNQVELAWKPSSAPGLAGYDVYANGSLLAHVTSTSYTASGLECGTTYTFGVVASDGAQGRSASTSTVAATAPCPAAGSSTPPTPGEAAPAARDTVAPAAPARLAQTAATTTSLSFTWKASADKDVTEYGVYVNGAAAGTTKLQSFLVANLACGKSYTIGVDAADAAGNRSARRFGMMSTSRCAKGDVQRPTSPSALSASAMTPTAITLSWKASTDNVAVAGYDVFAGTAKVGTTPTTSRAFSGLACGTSYTLGVEAFDAAGNRSARASLAATTAACPSGGSGGSADPGAASVFVAVGGSDSGSCSRSAPCASFGRAYQVAAAGAVVEVAGGSYPSQTIEFDSGKGSGANVVFRPAPGASVTLAEFVTGESKRRVGAGRFELRDMAVSSYVRLRWGSEDVVLRNLDAGGLNLTSVRGVQVLGGDYGPMVDGVSHINGCGVAGCTASEDILIDGAYFHDYTVTDPAKHSECLMIWPGRRVTIRNTTFRNCTDFDLLIKPYSTGLLGLPGEIVLENNLFDEPMPGNVSTAQCSPNCPRGGNAIAITQGGGESWGNVQIRNNSSLGGIRIDAAITNTVVSGNIARKDSNYSCQRNVSFSYNIWNAASCSATDRTIPFADLFVGPTSALFDLRLRSDGGISDAGASAAAFVTG